MRCMVPELVFGVANCARLAPELVGLDVQPCGGVLAHRLSVDVFDSGRVTQVGSMLWQAEHGQCVGCIKAAVELKKSMVLSFVAGFSRV